jgi:hypothetical protein
MSTQQTETASAGTSTPTSDGWILIVQIKPGQVDELLAAVGAELEKASDPDSLIGQVLTQVGTVHFARAAILAGDRFMFASHFDGSGEAYLDDFYTLTQGGLVFDAVFRYCEDWPGPGDREGFMNFWNSHRVKDLGIYSAYPGVTCKEIDKSVRIRRNMEAVLEDFQ